MDAPSFLFSSAEDASSSSSVDALPKLDGNLLTDGRDGKTYRVVEVKTGTWMAENLNYSTKNSKCYKNENSNCEKYGRLYTWEEAQTVCPKGWHLPKDTEWNALVDYAGGKEKAGKKLKTKNNWNKFQGSDGNGADDYGFSALPGGHGDYDGNFSYMGDLGLWWSDNMEMHSEFASSWFINSRGHAKNNDFFGTHESYFSSIRCVKD
jgi:uncharacterized protein (TIGR02145 family)